jgi:hypothetical protein
VNKLVKIGEWIAKHRFLVLMMGFLIKEPAQIPDETDSQFAFDITITKGTFFQV